MPDIKKRYISIRNVLIITFILNWAVAFAKIIFGLIIRSISMTADGFHSLSDGTSNIICFIGIWFASRPKDEDHPYGHKKYETFASIFIAVLLFLISINLLKEVFSRFFKPVTPDITPASFAVMAVTIFVNIFVVSYEYKRGKRLNSDILISDAMHTRSDIYASVSVIAAFIAIKMGFPIVDLAVGVFISILIAICGIQILRESSYVLCDGSAIDEQRIIDVVKGIKGVRQCHKIRTRGRQDDVHVDLHISVDTDMHVDKAHYMSHEIQNAVKKQVNGVTDVIVHIEPIKKIHAKDLER